MAIDTLDLAQRADRAPLGDAARTPAASTSSPGCSRRSASAASASSANGVDNLWARRGDGSAARVLRRPHRRGADRAARALASEPVHADDARRRALRPRRVRHENLARGFRRGDLGFRRRASRITRARSRCCSPPTRKGPRSTARCAWWRRCRERGEKLDYCIVGEPTCASRLGRHDQERPARLALRQPRW